MDKAPKWLTGWINGMDEITVAALWEGSKAYVKNHAAEFEGDAGTVGSEDYWKAVNRMYQRVIEETQPNYTTMQRAGIQRNPDDLVKSLTMFTTQRFQNYGILADAVGDYNAQRARYAADSSAENRAELQRAGQQLKRSVMSQVVQTTVFALMKIGADFLLHRWDREQDENGDITVKSVMLRLAGLMAESAAGNFLFGSEIYSTAGNAINGKDYDVISATSISTGSSTGLTAADVGALEENSAGYLKGLAVTGSTLTLTFGDGSRNTQQLPEEYTLTADKIGEALGFTPTKITYGTADLTAGSSALADGEVYLVYSDGTQTASETDGEV